MIYPLSLYRCIYFDPKTNLIKLARREEWTFYCESLADGERDTAKDRWQDYENAISEKENQVEKLHQYLEEEVTKLLSAIRPRVSAKKSVQEQQIEMQARVLTVLDEILIQLRFLIKHMAFREEQECRLYYVTDLLSPFVKAEFSRNSLYVDYQTIPEYVDKIYLGPEAIKQQSFFVKALGEKAFDDKGRNRIRISSNPFRNPQH